MRNLREQEEDMIQQENELIERQLRHTEEEEEEEGRRKRNSSDTDLHSHSLDYISPYSNTNYDYRFEGHPSPTPPHQVARDRVQSGEVLSPIPGSTSWESDLSEIELFKGEEGLGFSLLDFDVRKNSTKTPHLPNNCYPNPLNITAHPTPTQYPPSDFGVVLSFVT